MLRLPGINLPGIDLHTALTLVLAVICAVLLAVLQIRGARIETLESQAEAASARYSSLAGQCSDATAKWESSAKRATDELAACVDLFEDSKIDLATMRDRAERAEREAAKRQAEWQKRWDARTSSCGAALLDMEKACESLSPY